MASQTASRVLMLFFVVLLILLLILRSEARSLKQTRIDSRLLLNDLGYDKYKLEYFRHESIFDSGTRRVSPGGPDPNHN
ncbi:hypothetical protein WN943_010248 [Citrus x changshan-huyou]|uniref:Uncharacterized protein n=2 Tax=Citrus TaxID=2706 RepID=A0A067DW34_CITSI|nr:hypothetical protein CISIN_1g048592mg [Citrus sinensis]GAY66788.1 hypothetical protein CUMW_251540 [Citrus unshiu]